MGEKPKRIVAQSVHSFDDKKELSNREKWATICFYYPQYTLKEASKLKFRDINLLLKTANRIQAEQNLLLLDITNSGYNKNRPQQIAKELRKFINQ